MKSLWEQISRPSIRPSIRDYVSDPDPGSLPPVTGDCYEAAVKYMYSNCMSDPDCGLILVHGEVAGQGPLEGMTFGHAWVLEGSVVVDNSNGRNLTLPMQVYYAVGGIDRIGNTHTYTWKETREKLIEFEHYGPWDLATESGY